MGSAGPDRPFSYLTHLECGRCGRQYDSSVPQGLCECGSPLLARYDLAAVGAGLDRAELAGPRRCGATTNCSRFRPPGWW